MNPLILFIAESLFTTESRLIVKSYTFVSHTGEQAQAMCGRDPYIPIPSLLPPEHPCPPCHSLPSSVGVPITIIRLLNGIIYYVSMGDLGPMSSTLSRRTTPVSSLQASMNHGCVHGRGTRKLLNPVCKLQANLMLQAM